MANPSDWQMNCWVSCALGFFSSLQLTCALRCQDYKHVWLKSFLCVFVFAQHFPLSAKPLFLCLQEYFEIQVFDSIFVVNTTFSRVGVGKQMSAPTGNGLTGYQARPSFADSCWAFALTNPSGLTSRRFCRFVNSRGFVSAFSSASQTNLLALVRQVSTPYRSTIVIELHWSWCRIQNLKQFLLAAPLQIWSSTITYGRRW